MATIVTRSGKGSPLTNNEVDANFNNLNSGKAELSGATFTGAITANAGVVVDTMTLDGSTLTSTGDFIVDATADIIFDADANDVLFKDGGTEYFRITNNGTSTVKLDAVGDIILDADGGDIYLDDGGTGFGQISGASSNLTIKSSTANKDIIFQGNDGGSGITALTLDMSEAGSATFNQHIFLGDNGFLVFGVGEDVKINSDGANGIIGAQNGNLTLDVAGDIILDADGGDLIFKDGGASKLFISNSSDNVLFTNAVQDKDLIFKGYDGTSLITALTLDMSAAGAATFNAPINVGGTITGDDGLTIDGGAGNAFLSVGSNTGSWTWKNYQASHKLALEDSDGTGEVLNFSTSGAATFNSSVTIGTGTVATPNAAGDELVLKGTTATGLTISNTSNSGVGSIFFGDAAGSAVGQIRYSHATDDMTIIADDNIIFQAGAGNATVFNANGFDVDFRVESDNDSNALFVEGSSGNVGIGTGNPAYQLEIGDGTDASETLNLKSTNTGSTNIFFSDAASNGQGRLTYAHSDNVLKIYTADAERMRIDSSGAVKINGGVLELGGEGVVSGNIHSQESLYINADSNGTPEASPIVFGRRRTGSSGGIEDMRLDGSGNLLVGTTSTDPNSTAGAQLSATGRILATVDGGNPGYFNRLTSDGELIRLEKNGTTVGSIGTGSGLLTIGTGTGNLLFENALVAPCSNSSLGASNGVVDLGAGSRRFKDLYLSGGVHLGGTGAANKLDDYEEGTWTPIIKNGSTSGATLGISVSSAHYTKVGRMCTITSHINRSDATSLTLDLILTNLPFTQAGGAQTGGTIWVDNASADVLGMTYANDGAVMYFRNFADVNNYIKTDDFHNGRAMYFSRTYETT